jgi:hypothetical protein
VQEPAHARGPRVRREPGGRLGVGAEHRRAVLAPERHERSEVHDEVGARDAGGERSVVLEPPVDAFVLELTQLRQRLALAHEQAQPVRRGELAREVPPDETARAGHEADGSASSAHFG